ncbi:sensor domain-containing diguanylate cyclase, partial [bacterium]|nr:sensor domain-containing diguanylate cyclase [bacterium]
SVGKFDLSIKAIVPIIKNEKFIGIIEVISHFNSISKQLSESNIYSLVLLKKEYKKQLEFPFTNLFIDDYYVANLDAPKVLMDYLQARKIEEYFNDSYKVENGYIIASYGLRNNNSEPLGYFVMFKKIKDLSSMDLDFFMFKWFAISIIIILSIIMIVVALLFYANTKQKKYYKNIIDTASNIVILNDGKTILDVNKAFFKYFIQYKTLEEFKKEHTCICDYFIEENEYLKKDMNGQSWVLYLVENKNKNIKVGMNFYGKIQYFFINASLVSEEKHHYSIVLSDITKEENYKNKLEHLSITDALTGIGNRRQFNQKIKDETVRANRYSNELSVIMFDIDFFKQVNDRHGHNIGDNVLVEYTLLISSMLRENDVFCRTGGEEFVIILPHVNKEDTRKIAEKIRKKVQESRIIVPITISMGVVEYIHGEDIEFVLKRVDDALYEAKNRGRNKVVVG